MVSGPVGKSKFQIHWIVPVECKLVKAAVRTRRRLTFEILFSSPPAQFSPSGIGLLTSRLIYGCMQCFWIMPHAIFQYSTTREQSTLITLTITAAKGIPIIPYCHNMIGLLHETFQVTSVLCQLGNIHHNIHFVHVFSFQSHCLSS